jgi:hypothetical protein
VSELSALAGSDRYEACDDAEGGPRQRWKRLYMVSKE